MPHGQFQRPIVSLAAVAVGFLALSSIGHADHSWGPYHWARTANPLTLDVGDNVSSAWDDYLDEAISDWGQSSVIDLTKVAGGGGKSCRPTTGRIEVCSRKYGNNGWLGLAQIWITAGEHITQATTKVNDTYFNTSTYNTPAWRRLVMCQEIGHDFGLDHQDETFDNPNLGTCMDYTNDPDGGPGGASNNDRSNEHPNAHDYEQLETIYESHVDDFTTAGLTTNPMPPAASQIDLEGPGQWGRRIRSTNGGRTELYELDFGRGDKVFTFVIWANGARGHSR